MCKMVKMVRVTFNALTYLFGVQSFFKKNHLLFTNEIDWKFFGSSKHPFGYCNS